MNTSQILLPQPQTPQPPAPALDVLAKAKEIKGGESQQYTCTEIKGETWPPAMP